MALSRSETGALRAFQARRAVHTLAANYSLTHVMKKILLLTLVALLGVASGRAEVTRDDLVRRVESCEAILQTFQIRRDTAIPSEVWQRAKAVIILNQFKAGFFIGVQDGYGVILVKKPNGRWSVPVLINAGEASLGFQLGVDDDLDAFEAALVKYLHEMGETRTPAQPKLTMSLSGLPEETTTIVLEARAEGFGGDGSPASGSLGL